MKKLLTASLLALALASGAGAQLTPIAQPIRVKQLPPCNQRMQNLAFQVIDATNAATCTGGGSTISICSCNGGVWSLMSGVGSTSDHGMLTGLLDDDHTQYPLLAGRGGGQVLTGSPTAGESLVIRSDDDAGYSKMILGDEAVGMFAKDGEAYSVLGVVMLGAGQGKPYAGIGTNGLGGYFSVLDSAGEVFRVDDSGNVGLDGRLRVGQSDSDANSSCISRSTDRLYGDLDCDGVKDATEYFLDDDASSFFPLTSAAAVSAAGDSTLGLAYAGQITVASSATLLLSSGTSTVAAATTSMSQDAGTTWTTTAATSATFDVAGGDDEMAITAGKRTYRGASVDTPQTATCEDDAAGTNAALTLLPTSDFIEITSLDAQGCDVTMSEVGMVSGRKVEIVVISLTAGAVNLADSAAVTELAGNFAMALYDSISLRYSTARWIETNRSNN